MYGFTESIKRNYQNSRLVFAQQYHEWLEPVNFKYFFTGTFTYRKNDAVIEQMVNEFIKRLNFGFYGKHRGAHSNTLNLSALSNPNSMELMWVIEDNLAEGSHIHMLICDITGNKRPNAPLNIEDAFKKHWKECAYSINTDFQVINKRNPDHTVAYLLKDFHLNPDRLHTEHIKRRKP